jgi:anthranilate/para-aminobenzoate synthase component II
MGICLGHQLICSCLGYEIKISLHALHGEKIIFYWNDEKITVQRYNSLAVVPLAFDQEIVFKDELMILNYRNGRSYQFHPESIATDNSPLFFNDLLTFIQKK